MHAHCADQMRRQAAHMEATPFHVTTFERGDVVLVHQMKKRSHLDKRGGCVPPKSQTYTPSLVPTHTHAYTQTPRHSPHTGAGSKTYTARAVVLRRSRTNATHYQLLWITDGISNKEKAGDVSKRMWLAWRLKLVSSAATVVGRTWHPSDQSIVDQVMNEETDVEDPSTASDSSVGQRTLTDHQRIARVADK